MKARMLLFVCVASLLCALFVGARGFEKTTWEYKVSDGAALREPQLNNLGAQGWELAGITFGEGSPVYYFKRPK